MAYLVYRALKSGRRFDGWEFHSEHEELSAAEAAAESLCPKNEEIETEPGNSNGLKKAFFGSARSETWSARISVKEISS